MNVPSSKACSSLQEIFKRGYASPTDTTQALFSTPLRRFREVISEFFELEAFFSQLYPPMKPASKTRTLSRHSFQSFQSLFNLPASRVEQLLSQGGTEAGCDRM
ncbi:hypothetical protein [Nostoc sp.]|uniref:hypothetical protein n=1 Tax=Nostoc sp. TaxID=1180 RepID=UPI002FF4C589